MVGCKIAILPENRKPSLLASCKGITMGTKNNPGAFDCYANAEPDEPMFILLGRDKHAPALVWLWARLREISGEDTAKVQEAEACAVKMEEWLQAHGKMSVDLPDVVSVGATEIARLVRLAKLANVERLTAEEKEKQ